MYSELYGGWLVSRLTVDSVDYRLCVDSVDHRLCRYFRV